jgi:EAL domain-containing protein (putative c-di-GMP-specific phosphodiesterase class I)/GGDEF domain-containing protein
VTRLDLEVALSARDVCMERLGQAIDAAGKSSDTAALVAIDLDGVSDLEVELGTKDAAAALGQLGQSITEALPENYDNWFVRADRIWITMPSPSSAASVEAFALKVLHVVSGLAGFHDGVTSISGVAGIALYPGHGDTRFQIVAAAEAAIKVAHSEDRQVARADTTVVSEMAFGRWVLTEFPSAIENHQISFVHQPIVDLRTNRINKLEVLARWQHPVRGAIGPGIFVPHIENTQFGDVLFDKSLSTALRDQRSWTAGGLDAMAAVNLSATNLERWDLADRILAATELWGIPPDNFSIEITETALIKNGRRAKSSLAELAAYGMTISLDDFGTGYSSLSQISDYPISNVKVDRSITSRLVSSGRHRSIVSALLVMGEESGFTVTAEGVETEDDVRIATDIGCDLAQGYAFAKPMPVESVLLLPPVLPAAS